MTNQEIKETLEKQLQLLSEHSTKCITDGDLSILTCEMVSVTELLQSSNKAGIPKWCLCITCGLMLAGAVLNLIVLLTRFQP